MRFMICHDVDILGSNGGSMNVLNPIGLNGNNGVLLLLLLLLLTGDVAGL